MPQPGFLLFIVVVLFVSNAVGAMEYGRRLNDTIEGGKSPVMSARAFEEYQARVSRAMAKVNLVQDIKLKVLSDLQAEKSVFEEQYSLWSMAPGVSIQSFPQGFLRASIEREAYEDLGKIITERPGDLYLEIATQLSIFEYESLINMPPSRTSESIFTHMQALSGKIKSAFVDLEVRTLMKALKTNLNAVQLWDDEMDKCFSDTLLFYASKDDLHVVKDKITFATGLCVARSLTTEQRVSGIKVFSEVSDVVKKVVHSIEARLRYWLALELSARGDKLLEQIMSIEVQNDLLADSQLPYSLGKDLAADVVSCVETAKRIAYPALAQNREVYVPFLYRKRARKILFRLLKDISINPNERLLNTKLNELFQVYSIEGDLENIDATINTARTQLKSFHEPMERQLARNMALNKLYTMMEHVGLKLGVSLVGETMLADKRRHWNRVPIKAQVKLWRNLQLAYTASFASRYYAHLLRIGLGPTVRKNA